MTQQPEGSVEEIARIIDPHGWSTRDRQTAELNRMAATGEPVPPSAYDGPSYYTRDSIAKARTILSALSVLVEGEAFQSQPGCVASPTTSGSEPSAALYAAADRIRDGLEAPRLSYGQTVIKVTSQDASRVLAALSAYDAALHSIARNTCCDTCREAALVARAALREGGE